MADAPLHVTAEADVQTSESQIGPEMGELGLDDPDRRRDHHQPKHARSRGEHGAVRTRHECCLAGPNRLFRVICLNRAELVWLLVCSLGSQCTSRCRSSLNG